MLAAAPGRKRPGELAFECDFNVARLISVSLNVPAVTKSRKRERERALSCSCSGVQPAPTFPVNLDNPGGSERRSGKSRGISLPWRKSCVFRSSQRCDCFSLLYLDSENSPAEKSGIFVPSAGILCLSFVDLINLTCET